MRMRQRGVAALRPVMPPILTMSSCTMRTPAVIDPQPGERVGLLAGRDGDVERCDDSPIALTCVHRLEPQ